MAGSATANINSSTGSSVRGAFIGQALSKNDSPKDNKRLVYAVFTPNPFPKNKKPINNKIMLIINTISLAEATFVFATTIAMPVTPPNEKLFGNLKK
ncbi:hypothetical protein bsdtb5_00110 [Anaeromicropila herbilytica]|uniref:Uncharacterized protein n=1 Tax=Anaeromicropila herbilytica TaxID=2785025 RepID=A0A7R7IBF8_9FIRM|nr:hypothetical protein bsdtb5_00110 [Anaeromicropila herbilytica]